MFRPAALLGTIVCVAVLAAGAAHGQSPSPSPDPAKTVVFRGKGNAHGMGLAMDGVVGQFRAGWSYTRILDLFYDGTQRSSASGAIRVGLASAGDQGFTLPGGGTLRTSEGTRRLPPGATVSVRYVEGRYLIAVPGLVRAAQEGPPVPIGTPVPEPSAAPSPPPSKATPSPGSPAPGATPAPPGLTSTQPVTIVPDGAPALVRVHATGKRYRGRIEVRWGTGGLWAINHVDLETYVQGIAEERGAGWTVEGLKVLAVAARSLAVATRTWYDKHHVKGFDICPTEMCQVYWGYDGEFPDMTAATRQTAGEIRTYGGRAILAMYHGNGGGQTDSYKLVYGDGVTDSHPYLRAVTYPYAKPKEWSFAFTPQEVTARLRAAVGLPGDFRTIQILQRGESPRVRKVRVIGSAGSVDTTGEAFKKALGLTSIWFELAPPGTVAPLRTYAVVSAPQAGSDFTSPDDHPVRLASGPVPSSPDDPLPLKATASVWLAAAALATAHPLRRRIR